MWEISLVVGVEWGGVFDDDQIDAYIDLKMEEGHRVAMHPNPVEFDLYYKC